MASAIDTQSARAVSAIEHPPWRAGLALLLGACRSILESTLTICPKNCAHIDASVPHGILRSSRHPADRFPVSLKVSLLRWVS